MKKSDVFNHFILTRFNNGLYDKPDADEWMQSRLELFQVTKESVLSQTEDFKWVIAFDQRTPQAMVDYICDDERMIPFYGDIRNVTLDVSTPFVITSRLDNDDIYLPGAIKAIQECFVPQIYVIDMDYEQFDSNTGERYTSGNKAKKQRYRLLNNGPFLSLIEPSERVMTCYCRPHTFLIDGYPFEDRKKAIPSTKIGVYARMIIHSENMMNKITGYKLK